MKAVNKAIPDRVIANREDDRNGRGRRLGRQGWQVAANCDNNGYLLTHEISSEPCQSIVLPLGPAILESYVLALGKTGFAETLADERKARRLLANGC
jgi:hypothetical protein